MPGHALCVRSFSPMGLGVLLALEQDELPDPATIGVLGAGRIMLFSDFGSDPVQSPHGQQVLLDFKLNILEG